MPQTVSVVTRRQFTQWAAFCGLPVALASDERCGCDDKPPEQVPGPAVEAAPPAREDLLLQALLAQYPSPHLTPERLAGIRSGLRRQTVQSAELWRVALKNSDAPATVFHAR